MKKGNMILLIGMMAVLSACGASEHASTNAPDNLKQDPVELVVYYPFRSDWPEEAFNTAFKEPLAKKYPHITIKYLVGGTKGAELQDLLTAGQKIDILFASTGATHGSLIDAGMQYDITPLIKKNNYDLSKLDPSIVELAKKIGNGAIYGLPVMVPPSAIYYNKDIFDRFGVPYPKNGITWDELFDLQKKLTRTDGGTQYYGLGTSYEHFFRLNQRAIPLVDSKTLRATFDTDNRWKPYIENFTRFFTIPGYEGIDETKMSEPHERNRFFKDRTLAMFMAVTALHGQQDVNDLNWDVSSIPVFEDNIGPQPYPTNFYVTSISEHKDQAFQVISYLTSEEFQMQASKAGRFLTTTTSKAVKEAFGQDNPMYKGKNVTALQPKTYASPVGFNKYDAIATNELRDQVKQINAKKQDINTGLRLAAELANKKIDTAEAAKK